VSLLYTYYVFTTSLLEEEKAVFRPLEWHIRDKDIFNTPRSHHFFFFCEESLMFHPLATAAFRDSSFFPPSSSLHLSIAGARDSFFTHFFCPGGFR
jgi:hypothetical protein